MTAAPEFFEKHTEVTLIVPAAGASDLTDPIVRRTVIPERVLIHLNRKATPDEDREWAHVGVYGPRRLKSEQPGKEISSFGWESAVVESYHGVAYRPQWLTDLLAEHLPEGWPASLLDLKAGGSR